MQLIIDTLDHVSEAFSHTSLVCANLSSLTKITNRNTLNMVMKATIQPLVQINMPDRFLNPVEEPKKQTSSEVLVNKLKKVLLLKNNTMAMECQPRNGPTRILAAALWLKLKRKFFSEGTVKEACQLFNVRAKQLSRVIIGCKYLGGTQQKTRK